MVALLELDGLLLRRMMRGRCSRRGASVLHELYSVDVVMLDVKWGSYDKCELA